MSDGLVKILDGNTFVVSDAARRHRGIADRSDGAVLVRHAVPLPLGADRQRRAAESALGRRPAVLRDAVLPCAGYWDRLRRRQAVGDPPARRRRRFSRGADDPQPSTTNRSISTVRIEAGCDFADLFEVKDALKKKGEYSGASRAASWFLATIARRFGRETWISASAPARIDEQRPDLQGPDRASRPVDDRSGRRH